MKKVVVLSTNARLKGVWEEGLKSDYSLFFFSHFDELMGFVGSGMDAVYIFHLESATEENIQKVMIFKRGFAYPLLVVSSVPNYEDGKNFIVAGASGYANANMHTVVLGQALEVLDSGGAWLSPDFAKELIVRIDNKSGDKRLLDDLSEREKEIAVFVADGLHNNEIAAMCNISERTVKAHIASIFSKLGIHDRVSLALYVKGV